MLWKWKWATHVLPVLFQQGDKEVNTHLYVLEDLFFLHTDIAYSYSHAEHFLKLEFDHGLGLINLWLKRFLVGNKCRELPCKAMQNIKIRSLNEREAGG